MKRFGRWGATFIAGTIILCSLCGCGFDLNFLRNGFWGEDDEPIVGQWVDEEGYLQYLILENGEMYSFSISRGKYSTFVPTREKWYKEDGKYYRQYSGARDIPLYIKGDTLMCSTSYYIEDETVVYSTDMYEWHRVPEDELIPLDDLYCYTLDENQEFVQTTLDEFLEAEN